MKRSFFQAAVTSILLYGCTTWTLTKRLEKKLDGNYTRMLRAILNKSWRQHPTRHQLYGHLPPIRKTIQVRQSRHAGHCWRTRDELIRDVLLWTPHMAVRRQDDQHGHIFSSYVRIRDVALRTCLGRWTIGRSGERGSGISARRYTSTTWWWWWYLTSIEAKDFQSINWGRFIKIVLWREHTHTHTHWSFFRWLNFILDIFEWKLKNWIST